MPRCEPCDCIIDFHNPLVFNGFDLFAEWLIWKVQQKATTFVLTPNGIHQPFPPSTVSDAIGEYKSASFDWSSGVRIGLGYTVVRDAWNFLGQYTYYQTSGSDKVNRPADQTLYLQETVRDVNLSTNGVDVVRSHTHFRYQVADLLLSRRFLPACQIIFNFFTGATGAWIREDWKVTGSDINSSPNVSTSTYNNWNFRGGGIRAGLDVDWHMGSGFSLFNKGSFAAVIGSYENRRKTTLNPAGISVGPNPTLAPSIRHTSEDETWVVPHTQLEFGINWRHRFCTWAMMLQAGFEINTWYDLHQFHQDSFQLNFPNNDRPDYRNASPVNLWGASLRMNASF